jgi:membrane associated rhomboid family serine protease
MLLPYGTDAPLRRPPWGTFSLITANVVLFLMQDNITPQNWYVLKHGAGLHPIQWLLSAFAHANWCHLLGNMIFLFSFGVVVESMMKLHRFLALYFAMAIVQNLGVQVMMLNIPGGGSLGASGAIYGLIMVGALCAPGKNVRWIWIYYYTRMTTFEVPVLITGIFYFFWDFSLAMYDDFAMSTPFLHTTGALAGLGLGVLTYRFNWFQNDGEDLWSRFRELIPKKFAKVEQPKTIRKLPRNRPQPNKFGSLKTQVSKLDAYLAARRFNLANVKLAQIEQVHKKYQLTENQLVQLINLGTGHQQWESVLRWMEQYLAHFTKLATKIRLNQARIQVVELKSPTAATQTLNAIFPSELDPTERALFYRLKRRIAKMKQLQPVVLAEKGSAVDPRSALADQLMGDLSGQANRPVNRG